MTVIATAGHVDHGKSSLVRALTGTDPDRLSEEKQRGMTIDLGFAHTTTPDGVTLSFIDVPGHVDFIRNMIAGVSHVGVVLLAVDAAEGWMPQTTEHCDVVSLLGSKVFVVALTKSDRVTAEHISQVDHDVRRHLAERVVQIAAVIPTSTVTGEGIEEIRGALIRAVTTLDDHRDDQRCRLFIDRVFTMSGAGTVVTGTLQGEVSIDDRLSVVRSQTDIRVRGIQTLGQSVETARGPRRVALNITGAGVHDLVRGDVLIVSEEWKTTTQFDASFHVLPTLQHNVSKRGQYILHIGTADQEVQLRLLGTHELLPGDSGNVRCVFQTPLAVLPGDRFVVRETGRSETVGGGVVLDAHPVIAVTKAQPDGSLETYLSERGWLPVAQVRQETNWHVAPIVGEWIATNDHFQRTAHALEALIDQSPQGVDVATLQPWERLLLEMIDGVTVSHGIARRGTAFSADEERIATLVRDGGLTGADNTTLSRDAMRRLVQHNIVYEHDGIAFHADVLDGLHDVLARLWDAHPEGFTVASLRDATGLTRKFAVPLGTVLDKRGLTKRVGDLRLPGPRFTQLS